MSSYYTTDELQDLGFSSFGKNFLLSRKASLYGCENMRFGNNVRIDDFCVLSGKIEFGSHIHITPFCLLAGAEEGIFLEDFSTLAYRCSVFTRSDDYTGETLVNSTVPEEYRYKTTKKAIRIGRHAVVGAGSVIFPGADIAEGVSVGAMSLVLKPTEEWSIYVGVPAKKLRSRSTTLLNQERQFLATQVGRE